jgi:UDP-glucose 4-epimerase
VSTFLVTGGAGFIGSHLCDRLLAEGKQVVAVDSLSTGRIANLAEARGYGRQFTFYTMDIRAEGVRTIFERHQPEVVMHLAAQASVPRSVEEPQFDASVNILGLLNVLDSAVAVGTRKVVFAASAALYGEPRTFPVKETSRKGSHPASPYGVSKKVAEDYLTFYRRVRKLDYAALALANVYGPRQDAGGEGGVIAVFAAKMLVGETPTILGNGEQTRDFVFVDDVVHAFAVAAAKASGSFLNIGTGTQSDVNTVFRLLAKLTEFRGEPLYAPPRSGDLRRHALDVGLASKELGWEPWTSLEEGLKVTVDSFRGG